MLQAISYRPSSELTLLSPGLTTPLLFSSLALDVSAPKIRSLIQSYLRTYQFVALFRSFQGTSRAQCSLFPFPTETSMTASGGKRSPLLGSASSLGSSDGLSPGSSGSKARSSLGALSTGTSTTTGVVGNEVSTGFPIPPAALALTPCLLPLSSRKLSPDSLPCFHRLPRPSPPTPPRDPLHVLLPSRRPLASKRMHPDRRRGPIRSPPLRSAHLIPRLPNARELRAWGVGNGASASGVREESTGCCRGEELDGRDRDPREAARLDQGIPKYAPLREQPEPNVGLLVVGAKAGREGDKGRGHEKGREGVLEGAVQKRGSVGGGVGEDGWRKGEVGSVAEGVEQIGWWSWGRGWTEILGRVQEETTYSRVSRTNGCACAGGGLRR